MNFRSLLTTLALVALTAVASAGVVPGTRYETLDGGVVQFSATLHAIHNTTSCTVTDGQGTSDAATGTPTGGSCAAETDASGTMSTDDGGIPPGNHQHYRVGSNKKMQQKDSSGDWQNLKLAKGIQPTDAPDSDQECDISWDPPGPVPDITGAWSDFGIIDPFEDDETSEPQITGLPPTFSEYGVPPYVYEGGGQGGIPPTYDTVGSHPRSWQ